MNQPRLRSVFGLVVLTASTVHAATVGFTEDFNAGLGGFGGGSQSYTLREGGVGGIGDSYLEVANSAFASSLGARTVAAEFIGDLTASGVSGLSFWLNDVGVDDDLEIHVGVGTAFANFWITTIGFAPPDNGWGAFSVDITDPAGWTQIIGTGTFADALTASNRLLFRHDRPPLVQHPDQIQADFGLDRISVVPEPTSLALLLLGGMLAWRCSA